MSDYACCRDPKPRVSERSGRMFCASCRTYLDHLQSAPEPRSGQPDDRARIVPASPGDAPGEPQEGDPSAD